MSALCQKRPNAPQQKAQLFDRLVSGDEQLIGHGEAEHPGGLVAGPDVAMQESDGANPVCSLLRLPVPILSARRVAATPPPFGPGMRQGPRWAASGRRRPTLSRKRSVVRRRNGHADQLLDVAQVRRLFAVAERDRDACSPGSRGAADAVHIGFRHVRQIEIHDVADAVDIDTARRNVGGDKRQHVPPAKCGEHALALVLRFVAVDGVGRDAGLGEAAHYFVGAVLGAGEYERATDRLVLQNFSKDCGLRRAIDTDDALLDALDGGGRRRYGNPGRVAQHLNRERGDGAQLWAERFDVERTDLLEVQDEIVGRLARAIGLKVIDVEGRRTERERPKSTDATDLLMRAKVIANRPSSRETMIGARDLYEQALKVEPENIDALAGVATTLVFEVLNGYYRTGNEQRLLEAEELLARTLAVEPRHLVALKASAALRRAQGKFEEGIAAAEAVISENPGEPWAYKEIGFSAMYLGSPIAALDWFAKAERLGPRDPARWTWLDGQGHALILLGRDEEAVRSLRAALDSNPNMVGTYALLASAYALAGQVDKSRLALAQYQKYYPDVAVGSFRSLAPVPLKLTTEKYRQQFERLKEGLRKAGMPG